MTYLNNDIFGDNSKDQEKCKFQKLCHHYCKYNTPLVVGFAHLGVAKLKTQLNSNNNTFWSVFFSKVYVPCRLFMLTQQHNF